MENGSDDERRLELLENGFSQIETVSLSLFPFNLNTQNV
jgi:hypothetical protein